MPRKYRVIYADPPWKFGGSVLQTYSDYRFSTLGNKFYPTMTVREISSLPISNVADYNCALFLWVPDSIIPMGLEVINSWGFRYVAVAFVWVKKHSTGSQVATVGAWTMKNVELCLLATRGSMLPYKHSNNVQQLIEAERTTHSAKPAEARQRIEQIFSARYKIELFARQKVDGWDCWGNELPNDIQMEDYK